ncbi:hypothetical protein AB4144_34075, partial [Rhizobiaceae sp. 2RAB30]
MHGAGVMLAEDGVDILYQLGRIDILCCAFSIQTNSAEDHCAGNGTSSENIHLDHEPHSASLLEYQATLLRPPLS